MIDMDCIMLNDWLLELISLYKAIQKYLLLEIHNTKMNDTGTISVSFITP